MEPSAAPRLVVFTPEFIGQSLVDDTCAAVLVHWRNRVIRPVVCRELLLRYLKLLRQLGLTDRLIQRWAWWFTHPTAARIVEGHAGDPSNLQSLCDTLALRHAPCWVIHGAAAETPPEASHWLAPDAVLRELTASYAGQPPAADQPNGSSGG